nr:MAG TPA: hypothetical protein [Bacteriophage sp.]
MPKSPAERKAAQRAAVGCRRVINNLKMYQPCN